MIKGLQLTLVTVAVVLMGMSAMATAPVISEIPSPIVGNGETTTPPNEFVYPDAINLNAYVEDDGGDANIVWSYEVSGEQIYSINGNDPIDSGSEDPTNPTDKDLNTVRNGEQNPDGSALGKITIRNEHLSPLGGTYLDPGATEGILESETQVVTLYASDGSTYSQTEVMVYTDNGGLDRLSGVVSGIPVVSSNFQNNANGFTSSASVAGSTTVTLGDNGICIEVAAGGNNLGVWTSAYGYIPLEPNCVYRLRTELNGTQTDPEHVPLWDMIIQNFDNLTGANGAYAYFADYYFLGKTGASYAVGPTGGLSSIDIYYAPLPAKMAAWNDETSGAFTTTNDPKNDMQLIFRILDADQNAGYGGEVDSGQICIQSLEIDRFDLDTSVTPGTVAHDLPMTEANYFALGLTDQTDIDWTVAGQLTWGMKSTFSNVEIMALTPGEDTRVTGDIYGDGDPETLFPIAWEDDKIYMIEVDVSAPTAGDEDNPVDVIQVGMDGPTWENFMVNSVTRGDSTMHNLAMPKNGDPEPYVSFFRSDKASLEGTAKYNRLRARMQILNSQALVYNSQSASDGSFTVHGITVTEVTIP